MDEVNRRRLVVWFEASKPYVLMIVYELLLAIFMILVQYLLSGHGSGSGSGASVSSLVLVVYEHIIATIVLSLLAFFLEKNRRPPFSFKILWCGFLLGGLQITLSQLLLTMSLEYIASTFQSIGLNLIPAIVFVSALIFGQEKLNFGSINGQAKTLGIVVSVGGALALILWKGPVLLNSMPSSYLVFNLTQNKAFIGTVMIIVGVLSASIWDIFTSYVTNIYPAELSLTAIMSFFGTIQTAIVSVFLLPSSSWKPNWEGGLTLVTILIGGFFITGIFYYVRTWVIKKKGAVFSSTFNPLLVVFSFLLQTLVLGSALHLGSIVGAFMVVLGLYIILWAKANEQSDTDDIVYSPLI